MIWTSVIVIFVSAGSSFVSGLTFQSIPMANIQTAEIDSTWNDRVGRLGFDGNVSSCAQSGSEFQSFFEVKLSTSVTIKVLKVIGKGDLDNLTINIGNKTETTALPERCANWIAGPIKLQNPGQDFYCRTPITGDIITLKSSKPSILPQQVTICEIQYA